ncbi:hypothetical protein V9L05_18895 [Bernardetia sp. Wsw4-3y2]|uniref:hypothetical protein n=1 Tax=Bernardetia sp. Wsw4-3y2 TaxID=3127471 RepID=UPI0030D3336E
MLRIFRYNISAQGRYENSHIFSFEWADSQELAIRYFQKRYFDNEGYYPKVVKVSCVDVLTFNHSLFEVATELRKSEKALFAAIKTQDHTWIGKCRHLVKEVHTKIDKILFPKTHKQQNENENRLHQ